MILANLRAGIWRYSAFALGVLAVALLIWGLFLRAGVADAVARAEAESLRAETLQTELSAISQAKQEAAEANEALRQRLAKPAPGQTIREVSHANPSDCAVPAAVADSVLKAVDTANSRAASK